MTTERDELEIQIINSLRKIKRKLYETDKRIELAIRNISNNETASVRIVPEQKTLDQDLKQIASDLHQVQNEMDARMEDYQNLLELIEEQRENDNSS